MAKMTAEERKQKQQLVWWREYWKEHPEDFAERIFGVTLWEKQIEVIRSLFNHKAVAVRSGHSVGKSLLASVATLLWLTCYDTAMVVTTAPTWRQIETILWREIHNLMNKARTNLGVYELSQTELRLYEQESAKKKRLTKFAIGISTDQGDRFQGLHNPNTLFIADEASGIPEPIFDAANGILTTDNSRRLLIGNPTSASGTFYNAFKSPAYHKIRISCMETPNYVQDREVIPGLATRGWVSDRKAEWGEESPLFQSRVMGEFPSEGDDVLIPLKWVEASIGRGHDFKNAESWQHAKKCIGIDVARFGTDTSVMTALVYPKVVKVLSFHGKRITELVGAAIQFANEIGIRSFAVDDTGIGGGLVDVLIERGYNVYPVNFGSKPLIDNTRFRNLKTEMFWQLREEFRNGLLALPDTVPEYLEELPQLRYELTSDSQIQIVSKKKMKAAGYDSPDFADSLAIALLGSRQFEDGVILGEDEWGAGEDAMVNGDGY